MLPRRPPSTLRPDALPAARPRVLIPHEFPTVNGGERSLLACVPHLERRFDLVAFGPGSIRGDPSPLHEAWTAAGHGLVGGTVRGLIAAHRDRAPDPVRALAPDLVHANGLAVARQLGRHRGVLPGKLTGHLRDIVNLSAAATADLARCGHLVAVSQAVKDHHVARGLPAEKVTVVHNGIDPVVFLAGLDEEECRRSVRAELNIPGDAPVVLAVGQIILRKAWDVLAEAAAGVPDAYFLCVGERHSRKAETVAYEAAAFARLDTNAPGRVRRLGRRGDVARLMRAADVLAHPARQEPFGRVLLEAAAAGLPIVACEVGGTREMLGDAFVPVPTGDAAALAAAITGVLDDPTRRTALRDDGRKRAGLFPVEKSAAGLAAVWAGVLR